MSTDDSISHPLCDSPQGSDHPDTSEEDEFLEPYNPDNSMATVTEVPCDIPGKRSFEIRGITFTVNEKYDLMKAVGVGAYGIVMAAIDRSNGELVALKKICGVFEDLIDAKRILREIRLMQSLEHENVSLSFYNWFS